MTFNRLVPHRIPGLVIILDAAGDAHDRGVVDDHVDAAAPGERLAPQPVDILHVLEIGADELHALGRNGGCRFLGTAAVAAIMGDEIGAGLAELCGDGGADALRGAGEKDGFSVEFEHANDP